MQKYFKIQLILLLTLMTFSLKAQNINIPDQNFKKKLIAAGVDKNGDGVIQESEALLVTSLDVSDDLINSNNLDDIKDLTGIQYFTNLTSFDCSKNQISIMNIGGLTKLTKLHCKTNKLTNLDISNLTKLNDLDCSSNILTTLDVSKLTNLTIFNYNGNKLSNLDISKLTKLTSLNCAFNTISSLDVSHLTSLITLDCGFNNLSSIDVSKLTNLTSLRCTKNSLATLDVSKLQKLTDLNCEKNQLSSLNISMLTNLNLLNCSENNLTNLNLGSLINITDLNCSKNQLSSLDVSKLANLGVLDCSVNKLTNLSLGNIINLKKLYCSRNQFANLEVNNQFNLTSLDCSSNKLTNINLTTLFNLVYFNCSSNLITSLNINPLINLSSLYCSNNKLTSLNVDNQVKLRGLYCDSNQITSINLSNTIKLWNLNCSVNQLTSLDVSKLTDLDELKCFSNKLTSLNVNSLTELKTIDCSNNLLTNLDISRLSALEELNCSKNKLTSLNAGNLANLTLFDCNANNLTTLNVSNSPKIYSLSAKNNLFKSLDLNNLTELYLLDITQNNQLEALYIKNGQQNDFYTFYDELEVIEYYYNILEGNNKLKYICTDDYDTYTIIDLLQYLSDFNGEYYDIIISSLCNSTTVGTSNYLRGKIKYDANSDGCNKSDKAFPNIKVKISNTLDSVVLISGVNGNFSTYLGPGNYTTRPILEHPNYYSISPQSVSFTLPDTTSPTFCITPNGVHNDLSVSVIPVRAARPGFSDAIYKVVYKNQGTTTQNGTIAFNYDEVKMNFISASPIADNMGAGNIRFDFINLAPFETRSSLITMRTNAPTDNPAVNSGDVLEFTAAIVGAKDETPDDNLATLSQTVVGSFDPNDKTCLEGEIVSPELIGKNVHYLIRFENTGTANAENIVVTDYIDTTVFEISTLQITDASHTCHTQISQGNKVQFIFSDIQLPFTESNKHGYVAFSIKLKENLVIGDSIKNKADIYFDYNLPVETNIAAAEINYKTVTYIGKNQTLKGSLDIYPNPSNGQFALELKANVKALVQISILNVEGKVVFAKTLNHQNQSNLSLDLKHLAKGVYLIKAQIENDVLSKKVVIQ